MMRIEATKFLVSRYYQIYGLGYQIFCERYQIFGNHDQNFGYFSPHNFLVGETKNEGQPWSGFWSIQPNHYLVVPTLTKG